MELNKPDGFGSDVEKNRPEGILVELDEAVVKIALSQHEIRIYESFKILLLLLPEPLLQMLWSTREGSLGR